MRKKKTWKSRLLGCLLAAVLAFCSTTVGHAEAPPVAAEQAVTGLGAKVQLQIEGYGYTVETGKSIQMPQEYKTYADYGLTGVQEPKEPGFTVLHVMAEYCVQEGMQPAEQIQIRNGYVSSFLGLPEKYLMFVKNRLPISTGVETQKIEDGDTICAADVWIDSSNWTIGAGYAWFSEDSLETSAQEPFLVELNVNDILSGKKADPSGAEIQVRLPGEETLVASAQTDAAGKATLMIDEPGNYEITAERRSDFYDTDGTHPWDITIAHGLVQVGPAIERTDQEVVDAVKGSLDLGDMTAVKENLTLPTEGIGHARITWESSDETVIKADGTVTRAAGEDRTAALKAVITKGTAAASRTFEVTVKGYSLLLDSLSIEEAALEFAPEKEAYTVYTGKTTETLHITASAEEKAFPQVMLFINGTIHTENAGTQEVAFSLEDSQIQLPIKVKSGAVERVVTVTVKRAADAGDSLPDLPDITWGQHLGNKDNNAVTNAPTPVEQGTLKWESFSNGQDSWGSVYAGTPILVNQTIYAVRDEKLQAMDAQTGEVKQSVDLMEGISFYSNITYGGGMIFVPLGSGRIQCFDAANMKSMFVTEKPGGPLGRYNMYGSIHYEDGCIYAGYTNTGTKGYFAAYDTVDIDPDNEEELITPKWTYGQGSYYGTGSVLVGDAVIFAGDDGKLSSVQKDSGKELSTLQLDGAVRGAVVYADGYVWAATQKQKLYKVAVTEEGDLSLVAEGKTPLITNASPVIAKGKVYLTGGDFINGGFLAVYDSQLNLLAEQSLEAAANTPTVSTAYEDTYVYFTLNEEQGAVYAAKVTPDNEITVSMLYQPEHRQYSMSKVVAGEDGTLYYANDSGYLFAISQGEKEQEPSVPSQPSEETGQSGTSGKEEPKVPEQAYQLSVPKTREAVQEVKEKTADENMVQAIRKHAEEQNTSLTFKNVPEELGPEVFQELAKHPDFRLILDMGHYTLSILGSDVKNTETVLKTKITETEKKLSGENEEQLGNYQVLELAGEGPLPGTVTVVYPVLEKFADAEQVYLFRGGQLDAPEKIAMQKGHLMFTLEEAGEFILADQRTGQAKAARMESPDSPKIQQESGKMPVWGFLLAAAAILAVGGIVVGMAFRSRRKKEDTWEK